MLIDAIIKLPDDSRVPLDCHCWPSSAFGWCYQLPLSAPFDRTPRPHREQAPDPIAFVTYQMYAIVRDKLDSCISNTADVWDYATEVAVIGGIMINRDVGGDFFQPLSFEVTASDGF